MQNIEELKRRIKENSYKNISGYVCIGRGLYGTSLKEYFGIERTNIFCPEDGSNMMASYNGNSSSWFYFITESFYNNNICPDNKLVEQFKEALEKNDQVLLNKAYNAATDIIIERRTINTTDITKDALFKYPTDSSYDIKIMEINGKFFLFYPYRNVFWSASPRSKEDAVEMLNSNQYNRG